MLPPQSQLSLPRPRNADLIRRGMAVGGALFGERGRLRRGQIFEPFCGFLRSARAEVDGEVGFSADLVEEIHEFMRSEGVRLNDAAPIRIECCGSLATYPFAPVIFIGETPARPPHVWNFQRFECGDNVIADAACIWNSGIRADPDSFVDAVTQMFCELAEEVTVNFRAGLGHVDRYLNFLRGCHRRCHRHDKQCQAAKK